MVSHQKSVDQNSMTPSIERSSITQALAKLPSQINLVFIYFTTNVAMLVLLHQPVWSWLYSVMQQKPANRDASVDTTTTTTVPVKRSRKIVVRSCIDS